MNPTTTIRTRDQGIDAAINGSFSALRVAALQAQRLEASLRNAGFSPETLAAVVAASVAPVASAIYHELTERPLLAAIRAAETETLIDQALAAVVKAFGED